MAIALLQEAPLDSARSTRRPAPRDDKAGTREAAGVVVPTNGILVEYPQPRAATPGSVLDCPGGAAYKS